MVGVSRNEKPTTRNGVEGFYRLAVALRVTVDGFMARGRMHHFYLARPPVWFHMSRFGFGSCA